MQSASTQSYLATQVMTATPQKLRLMLIEGALRFGRQAGELWTTKRYEEAGEALIRCREIVGELIVSLNREVNPQLTEQIASLYRFVYRTLIDAHLAHDPRVLDQALKILEIERETWQLVCARGGPARITPHLDLSSAPQSGLTLEA